MFHPERHMAGSFWLLRSEVKYYTSLETAASMGFPVYSILVAQHNMPIFFFFLWHITVWIFTCKLLCDLFPILSSQTENFTRPCLVIIAIPGTLEEHMVDTQNIYLMKTWMDATPSSLFPSHPSILPSFHLSIQMLMLYGRHYIIYSGGQRNNAQSGKHIKSLRSWITQHESTAGVRLWKARLLDWQVKES